MPKSPAGPEPRPLIIAHRGASAHAPENTLIAFRKAVELGADGIELDVRLAGDGVAVVFHDPSLNRIAGRRGEIRGISSDELRKVDAGSWFNRRHPKRAGPSFADERIPSFRETLQLLKRFDGLLYVELKGRDRDIEQLARAVADEICDSPLLPRIVVKSFNPRALPLVRAALPKVRTAALFAPKFRTLLRREKHILRLAEEAGVDEISLHYTLATRKLVSEATSGGIDVIVWTVDRARWARRGAELGLKAIITNDPETLLAARERLAARGESGGG